MANYSLVIDSTFQPFSYEEMLKPVLKATAEHKELEENYAALEEAAEEWRNKANAETDPETYKRFMKYSQDLESQAGALARNGLTPGVRRSMLRMKSRYASEIKPIENAWNERRKLQEEQRKLLAADGTLRFDRDYRNISLDDMIANPNDNTYSTLSGNAVLEQTAKVLSNYKEKLLNDPEFKKVLNGQYFQKAETRGWSIDQILMAAANDPNAPKMLRDIKDQIHGAFNNNPAYDRSFVENWVNLGLNYGLGKDSLDYIKNGEYIDAATRMQDATTRRGQNLSYQASMARLAAENARAAAEAQRSRYQIVQTENGPVRLDTETGKIEISYGTGWVPLSDGTGNKGGSPEAQASQIFKNLASKSKDSKVKGDDPVIPTDKNPEFSTLPIWFNGGLADVGEKYIPGRKGGLPMGLFTSGKGTGNYRTYAHMANDTHWFGSHGAADKMHTNNPAFAPNRFKALQRYNSQTPANKEQWEALAAWGVPKDHYEYYAGFSVKEHMGERKNGVNGYQASIFFPYIPYITMAKNENGTLGINPLLSSPNIQWREEKPNNLNQWNWIVTNIKTRKNIRVPSTIANVKPKNNETMEQFKSRLDPNQRRAYEALDEMLWDEFYNSES